MSCLSAGNRRRLVLILVYTGNGKGKTTASIGQALRALGQGMSVGFAQFIKRPGVAGEQLILSRLLGENFRAGGLGFYTNVTEKLRHQEAARNLLAWANELDAQMLILDEVLYAIKYGLIVREELEPLITRAHNGYNHLVLSGRNAPQWIVEQADIVTEMCQIRHASENGVAAMPGIEF